MWTRSVLKSQAKANLRGKYWNAFAVTFIIGLLGAGAGSIGSRLQYNYKFNSEDINRFRAGDFQKFIDMVENYFTSGLFLATLLISVMAFIFYLSFGIFVSSVVAVGGKRWFSRNRESAATPAIGQIFSLFKAGSYLKTVGSMLWMNFFLFLWGLLSAIPSVASVVYLLAKAAVIIPDLNVYLDNPDALAQLIFNQAGEVLPVLGLLSLASILLSIPLIIKTYSYRMTPWILADNPRIGYRRALQLSMELTRGQKLEMFVLDLSFIGWYLLSFVVCCGISAIFLTPYIFAVQAELYATLRMNGVASGLCTMEELGFVMVSQEAPAMMAEQQPLLQPDNLPPPQQPTQSPF